MDSGETAGMGRSSSDSESKVSRIPGMKDMEQASNNPNEKRI
jgi:hypothetical protein